MYPHERSLVSRLVNEPFVFLGINSDESPEKFIAAATRERIIWPCLFDGGGTAGPIATRWGVRGWPTVFVVDAEGVIRFRDVQGEALDKAVDGLLAALTARKEE